VPDSIFNMTDIYFLMTHNLCYAISLVNGIIICFISVKDLSKLGYKKLVPVGPILEARAKISIKYRVSNADIYMIKVKQLVFKYYKKDSRYL